MGQFFVKRKTINNVSCQINKTDSYILKFSQFTKAKRGDDLVKMSFETNFNLKIAKKSKNETENRKQKGKK